MKERTSMKQVREWGGGQSMRSLSEAARFQTTAYLLLPRGIRLALTATIKYETKYRGGGVFGT